ncbi:uncharacterized protein HD556DRAFT_1309344 [Suillus plorans]|uniref:Uncharacterized protein n=1 Tax=Suillus plorans TaxID=116603 RepID=A0A9P7ANB1_9AGAM|nr:uncharacterized protein HD556DRAFT_1309344 [Suillus plorans]KAG1792268.1 hypothetical protein HD556DRAFT_1309344 [Suillus plorans]
MRLLNGSQIAPRSSSEIDQRSAEMPFPQRTSRLFQAVWTNFDAYIEKLFSAVVHSSVINNGSHLSWVGTRGCALVFTLLDIAVSHQSHEAPNTRRVMISEKTVGEGKKEIYKRTKNELTKRGDGKAKKEGKLNLTQRRPLSSWESTVCQERVLPASASWVLVAAMVTVSATTGAALWVTWYAVTVRCPLYGSDGPDVSDVPDIPGSRCPHERR